MNIHEQLAKNETLLLLHWNKIASLGLGAKLLHPSCMILACQPAGSMAASRPYKVAWTLCYAPRINEIVIFKLLTLINYDFRIRICLLSTTNERAVFPAACTGLQLNDVTRLLCSDSKRSSFNTSAKTAAHYKVSWTLHTAPRITMYHGNLMSKWKRLKMYHNKRHQITIQTPTFKHV
jgi:hypothetical protein